MDKSKEINEKSAKLEIDTSKDFEDETPLVVADQELIASYEKQQQEQKQQLKKLQEERKRNEEQRVKTKVMAESKLGNLTEDTTHIFSSKRERPEGKPKSKESGLARKRQKLLALLDEQDFKQPVPERRGPKLSFVDEDEDSH